MYMFPLLKLGIFSCLLTFSFLPWNPTHVVTFPHFLPHRLIFFLLIYENATQLCQPSVLYVVDGCPLGTGLCLLHFGGVSLATQKLLNFIVTSVNLNGIECPSLLERPPPFKAFLHFFLGLNLVSFQFLQ